MKKWKLRKLWDRNKICWIALWTLANAISYAGGGMISAFVTDYITGNLGLLMSFGVMSIAIALAQWLVMRHHIKGIGWLVTTWLGGTLGGYISTWVSFRLSLTYGEAVDFLVIYACLRGFGFGWAQSFALPKPQRSPWWICTTVSWYASIMFGSLFVRHLGYLATFTVGTIYGLLTGIFIFTAIVKST
ncbi:MAG: hypothetical protein NW214_04045 [Pseudanabaenaceae cyanobacterium bins.39]|nr:hypothetical protein [Pseudanabaenaceae cyanobacterium bins.39]